MQLVNFRLKYGKQKHSSFEGAIRYQEWKKQKKKLLRSLSTKKINWQGLIEKKGLVKLVADEKALKQLIKLLKKIKVGSKVEARIKARELERRNNHANENVLDN